MGRILKNHFGHYGVKYLGSVCCSSALCLFLKKIDFNKSMQFCFIFSYIALMAMGHINWPRNCFSQKFEFLPWNLLFGFCRLTPNSSIHPLIHGGVNWRGVSTGWICCLHHISYNSLHLALIRIYNKCR